VNNRVEKGESRLEPEVDIIGGSAAGLFAAYLLAREGKRVRLFDANDVLHAEPRTLITTSRLPEVLGFFPSEAVVNRIERIELHSPGRSASVVMEKPDLVVERSLIVRELAQKAAAEGVEILSGCKFLDLTPSSAAALFRVQNTRRGGVEEFRARTLIGADGAFSRVAQMAGRNGHRTAPVLQAVVELPQGVDPNTTWVWFRPEDTPYFFWLIPESTDRAAAGLITADGKGAEEKLDRFLSDLGLQALEIQAARIPLFAWNARPWRRLGGCNVYMVGDAAGQVKVTTVGGLVSGLRGAQAVANAILRRGEYGKELRALRRELGLHLLVRSLLNRCRGTDYDRLLDLLNHRMVKLLGGHTRDQLSSMLFRIVAAQPRLLQFASRCLRGIRRSSVHSLL
jgi:digeranylgeranylglycerophospholipid reductase